MWTPVQGPVFQGFLQRQDVLTSSDRSALEESCAVILSECAPPDSGETRTGLVLGRVQAGKTMSFTGVIAMAKDNGFRLVVVLAGTKRILAGQTTSRLEKDLGLGLSPSWNPPFKAVRFEPRTSDDDLAAHLHDCLGEPNDGSRPTLLITVLKGAAIGRLADALGRLPSSLRNDIHDAPTLVIDDEADEAGLNTSQTTRLSATYGNIARLRAALGPHSFLQYTATPQALLLIDKLDALSPDFGHLLSPGASYVGGEVFFGSDHPELLEDIPNADVQALASGYDVPSTLREAFWTFVITTAAELAELGPSNMAANRSFLVHPDAAMASHARCVDWVRNMKEGGQADLADDAELSRLLESLRNLRRKLDRAGLNIPGATDLRAAMLEVLRKTAILEINSSSVTEPDWATHNVVIAIGGNKLGRGYTLRGLTTTWMPRGLGAAQVDTLLQRARFFGYHSGYLDRCRVWLTADLKEAFEDIVPSERSLWRTLKENQDSGGSLKDWKRIFLLDPSLQPCRRNVVRLGHLRVDPLRRGLFQFDDFDPILVPSKRVVSEQLIKLGNDWAPWPTSRAWGSSYPWTSLPLAELTEVLSNWECAVPKQPYLRALLLLMATAVDENADEPAVVIRMAAETRSLNADGSGVLQLISGHTSSGRGFPGARSLIDPPPYDVRGAVTLQLYNLRLRENAQSTRYVATDVPFLSVMLPDRLRSGVVAERV